MYAIADLKQYRESEKGTDIIITVPELKLGEILTHKHIKKAEIRFDDGRHISAEQRKKAYATMRDISDYTGNMPEAQKQELKSMFCEETGHYYFSFKDCSMDIAREFINFIMDFCIKNGIPLTEEGYKRTDDIGKYLYSCLKHKKCAVCGIKGEIHHVDTIGMGNDRRKVDDSDYRKICLCRLHHTIAHQKGMPSFEQSYKVYGIVYKDEE